MAESLQNNFVVKAFGNEEYEIGQYSRTMTELQQTYIKNKVFLSRLNLS